MVKLGRALEAVELAAVTFHKREEALEEARGELHAKILDAYRAGASQAILARASGLSRSRVSQIVAGD